LFLPTSWPRLGASLPGVGIVSVGVWEVDVLTIQTDLLDELDAEALWDLSSLEEIVPPADIRQIPPEPSALSPRRPRRWLQAVVLAIPVVLLAGAAWTHRSMFVDGFIYLHVVQNILAGHGPVFNQGHRVEAFTSPVWTFVLAALGFLTPFPLNWIAVVVGILLTVGGTALAIVSSSRLVHRAAPRAFLLPLGAVAFVAVPVVWSLASMGLETGLSFFWIAACFALLVRWGRTGAERIPRFGLVVLGLGPLIRPELALDSIVFIGTLLWIDRSLQGWRGRVRIVAWAALLPFAYQIFRMGYYGVLVANTATAKEASLPRVGRGILYFSDFVAPYWLFIPALGLLVGAYYPLASALRRSQGNDRSLAALLALPIAGALNAGYIIAMGGDYVHGRLLIAPFFAACVPVATVPLARKYLISLLVIPWAIVCALSLRSADGSHWNESPFILVTGYGNVAPAANLNEVSPGNSLWTPAPGVYAEFGKSGIPQRLDVVPAPGIHSPVIATSWIGTEPYELGTNVQFLDLLGLADPLTAHLQLAHRGEFSGHEKPLPTPWIAALLTAPGSSTAPFDQIQDQRPTNFTQLIPTVSGQQLQIETAWARAALQCPAIHNLEYAPDQPLTVESFFSNMVHSFSRTSLRIPPDPETAYHQFCGPGTPQQVKAAGGGNG
jgi:arabinofuranosyltransferase